ncbi:MAG TPA: zf-HC2 domain-containing protein [Pyrinomonadaceae bacterium]|jgi:hypothetical protein|nr:zf-HC2 domain-containing protein [Pyrinomonadaceae bacterium]
MNCENYQILLSDFVDGALMAEDCARLELHLNSCPDCNDARNDLSVIVDFCREQRGVYDPAPNEQAMWLRISNLIEAGQGPTSHEEIHREAGWFFRLMNRSWQLSFPQLAGLVSVVILVVALGTAVGVRRFSFTGGPQVGGLVPNLPWLEDRYRQQQQTITYWNDRVEMNKARWSPQMRETFDRNMSVIDAAVNDSMDQLKKNPHDAISEDILNEALNDKVALLKEFSDL